MNKSILRKNWISLHLLILLLFIGGFSQSIAQSEWASLFNGDDFDGWVVPEGDNGQWKVLDGVIDYNAMSQSEGDKNLWTSGEFHDFELKLDWRLTETPYINPNVAIIKPDGRYKRDENGDVIRISMPDSDSGIYLRGSSKAQVNIWSWPAGSGEVWGYRTDPDMPDDVVAAATPLVHADNDIGEWNTFLIRMIGDTLTVELNGTLVIDNAPLPGVNESGPIALQHHGRMENGEWVSPPSLVQFRNIYIREL